jgi:cytochrome c
MHVMATFRTAVFVTALASAALSVSVADAQDRTADGERIFRTRCASCHSVEAGQNRVGPHLAGIIGRTAGSVEGARYSRALQASGVVWNEQTLDTFLANPRQTVPGTTMAVNLPNAADRAAVIGYLDGVAARTN